MAIVHALALDDYQSLRSTRTAYERALLLARAEPERRFLERRLDEL
jgi:predicted RNA polymerase sigma factor